jgi:tRNA1Val (adenine37-N6)-methyltransferase
MANSYFKFKEFIIYQDKAVFKVVTDGVLLGASAEIEDSKRILDIGTGTGLIAIMAAQRSDAEIISIEPEEASFVQATGNISLCKWSERMRVIHSGFRDYYMTATEKFDTIITNPPYFRDSLKNPDHLKSTSRHAGSLTSFEILEGANILLGDNGNLQIILPYREGNLFISEALEYGFYCNRIINVKPIPDRDVKRLIMKFEKARKQLSEKSLTIETGIRHQFTEEYKEITRDFYLNF